MNGEERLILHNTRNTLILNTAWPEPVLDTVGKDAVPSAFGIYKIKRYDQLPIPSPAVLVQDRNEADLLVSPHDVQDGLFESIGNETDAPSSATFIRSSLFST